MHIRRYLPSRQFVTIVGALALSACLVFAAEHVTSPTPPAQLAATSNVPSPADWQQKLDEIQANAGISLPEAPDQTTVDKLVAGVQSSNLTDTVARSVFIQLTNAKAQGLGDDIPTQQQLIAQATAAAQSEVQGPAVVYGASDIHSVAQNNDSLRIYGNKVMAIFAFHTKASAPAVLLATGQAVDYNDAKYLSALPDAQTDYQALAKELAAISVPASLVPFHVQLVNDLMSMSTSVGDLRLIVSDPLRGLTGLKNFEAGGDEATRVLTTIAGTLSKSGILFSKDEPGASWSAFVSGR